MSARVLVVDDDRLMADELFDIARDVGMEVRVAHTVAAARAIVDEDWRPHVILLDQRLDGIEAPDTGLDLLPWLTQRQPEARVILVTGYATPKAVRQAFQHGAHDYLEKGDLLGPLLRAKLGDAARLSGLAYGERERVHTAADLLARVEAAAVERDPQRKGALLEQAVRAIFQSIEGFSYVRTNVRNPLQEIDLVVRNDATDPVLAREGSLIVVECKNWTARAGVPEVTSLEKKVTTRFGRARLGVCVSMNGYASTAREEARANRREDVLLLLLDADDLRAWAAAPDRAGWFKDRIIDEAAR
jgi:ActR/RegA family two-component response regulator